MLITFTTEHGNLIIRSEDLRRLEDGPIYKDFQMNDLEVVGIRCRVEWAPNGEGLHHQYVMGTALENYARIMHEEAQVLAAYEEARRQQRYTRGGEAKATR